MPLSPQMPREQFTQKFPWFERTLLLTGAVFFLGFCFRVNRIRSPWADEVLGWTLLTDSSARHMMLAWRVGADGGGWPFYALGRLWFLLFGRSILSFRLFSATAFASAFVVTWRAARYFYSTAVVAVAMYVCWLCSWTILQQSSEARFYGLFLFAASTVFYFFAKSVVAREASVPLLLGVFCSNAFLVSSHVLGIIYSGTFFVALVYTDRRQAKWRPTVYLCQALSWLLLMPSWTAIRSTIDVGKPHFWLSVPKLKDLFNVWVLNDPAVVAVVLGLLVLLYIKRRRHNLSGQTASQAWPLVVLLLSMTPLFFIVSHIVRPIFLDRYLIPTVIGLVMLTAELLTLSDAIRTNLRGSLSLSGRIFLICTPLPILILFVTAFLKPEPNSALEAVRSLDKSLPVVCDNGNDFAEMLSGQNGRGTKFVYVLDWPTALDPKSPRGDVTEYHLMEKWKQLGYHSGSISQSEDFLRQTPAFYVFNVQGEQWFANRIWGHAGYTAEKIGVFQGHKHLVTLWRVTH